jgi:AraC-like DNA-binding protein
MDRLHHSMSETHMPAPRPLRETSRDSPHTREHKLSAEQCPVLALHRIAHVGWVETPAPYERVRVQPSGSYVQVSVSGEGRILLDGRWQICRPGMACLAPPRVLNAFHAVPGQRWHFCWVRYHEPAGAGSLVNAGSPVRTRCNPALLFAAIQGLLAESAGHADARLLHHWIELIHGEAQRLAKPWHVNERLQRMWTNVGARLAHPWSATELAHLAHCSTEHLRRLCLRELGRSPMQQVTYMRIQRAAELLQESDEKLATIAEAIGYSDAFVLSKTFKKWTGSTPSEYRAAG